MKFTEVLPSNIDIAAKKTRDEFHNELHVSNPQEFYFSRMAKAEIVQLLVNHTIEELASKPNVKSWPSILINILLFAVHIGWDLREHMEARYQDVDELERIIPDGELEAMLADMKRTGTAPALPKENK